MDIVLACSTGEFLDTEELIDVSEVSQPICESKFGASISTFDHLASIANKEDLKYSSEGILREVSIGHRGYTIKLSQ